MLSDRVLEQLKSNVGNLSVENLFDAILDLFSNELVTMQDKLLLNLAFSENPTQEDLDHFLAHWDIEAAGGHKAIMMAYFMKMHPNLHFTSYESPRLKGLLNFHRFANLKLMAHYTKLGRALNKAQIPVMIMKGGAMKFLRQDLPRVMGDIDALVPMDDFPHAIAVAKELGYDCIGELTDHSVDLHEPGSEAGTVDIHQFFYTETEQGKLCNEAFWARAKQTKIFGVDSFIPCPEDMVFMALINLAKNLVAKTSVKGTLYNLFDCKYLLEQNPNFDWNIVLENTRVSKTEVQLSLAIHFLNRIIPNLLPAKLLSTELFKNELEVYCENILFFRFYYNDLQLYARSMSIRHIFDSFHNFKEYLRIKPKYRIIKKLRKNPKFVHLFMKYKRNLGSL